MGGWSKKYVGGGKLASNIGGSWDCEVVDNNTNYMNNKLYQ